MVDSDINHRMALNGRTCPCCVAAMRWNLQIVCLFCDKATERWHPHSGSKWSLRQKHRLSDRRSIQTPSFSPKCRLRGKPLKLARRTARRREGAIFLKNRNTERHGQGTVWSKRRIDRLLQSCTVVRNSILNLGGVSEMRFCWIPQLAIHIYSGAQAQSKHIHGLTDCGCRIPSKTPPLLSSSPAFLETSWTVLNPTREHCLLQNIRNIQCSFALRLLKVAPHHGIAECLKLKVDVYPLIYPNYKSVSTALNSKKIQVFGVLK